MDRVLTRTNKTYPLKTTATAPTTPQLPTNPDRLSLTVQNTGGANGLVRFGAPNQGAGFDFTFLPNQIVIWDQGDTCPLEAVFFAGATTWSVMEGTRGHMSGGTQ